MCKIVLLLLALGLAPILAAQTDITASTDVSLQLSSRPEAKLIISQGFTIPFLRGTGPLTEGNHIRPVITAELSPVSLNGIANITWAPIAFFQLTAGGLLGSGWSMALGNGIGLNSRRNDGKSEVQGGDFGGLVWELHGGGVIQFDLAAILPGDWNHLVFRTFQGCRYRAYSAAADNEPWFFENDAGENHNGFTYYSNYFLGYQMPLSPLLDTLGMLVEMDKSLSPDGASWGEYLPRWYIGFLLNFTITQRFSVALLAQTRTLRNYGSSDLENTDKIYYQDLRLITADPYRLMFYRIAAELNYRLR